MTLIASRTLSAALLIASATFGSQAARGVLHADGLLRIKDAEKVGSSITVMPKDAPAYQLAHGGATRFMLDLDLDNTYMVSFQMNGCVTKLLYFDTRVPGEQHADVFTFPFQVTLESPLHAFTYAGPVGFIVYKPGLIDFGYETDYSVKVDESFAERMDVLTRTGTDPLMVALSPRVAAVVTRGYQRPGEAVVEEATLSFGERSAPNTNEVPLMVHRTGALQLALPLSPLVLVVEHAPADLPVTTSREFIVTAIEAVVEKPIALAITASVAPVLKDVAQPTPTLTVADGSTREEDLIVAARSVTTIVRIHYIQGRSAEYRKVVHAYGATFFFVNGLSVPEHMYASGTGF